MHSTVPKPARQTCNECRLRKVRCDGQRTGCANCQRLGFSCSFRESSGQNESIAPIRRPRRCRVRQACTACHELKIRCSGQMPTCHRCSEKAISCLYPNWVPQRQLPSVGSVGAGASQYPTLTTQSGSRVSSHLPANLEGQPSSSLGLEAGSSERMPNVNAPEEHQRNLLTQERVKSAIKCFFDYIYPLPTFSFLHQASLVRWNQAGQADHCLLLSIIAITSRLPGRDSKEVSTGTRCSALAQNLILRDQGRPTIIKAQSLLLIIRYHMWSGTIAESLILMATLTRFAFALRLNYENPNLCSLAQESRRRLMWAIFVLDTFLAGGLPEFTLCQSSVVHLPLPNLEASFELDISYANVPLHDSGPSSTVNDNGLLAYYIRVIYLRDSVLRYTKGTASSSQKISMIPANIRDLEAQLNQFALNLPRSTTFSEKNLHLRAFSKWLPRYIMTHLWFHQCYCDLYRCFFSNLRESIHQDTLYQLDSQFVLDCQRKCLYHARQVANICSLVQALDSHMLVLDIETAECVYQAGRILLHGVNMISGELPSLEDPTMGLVNHCVLFIKQLALTFPTVSSIANDLDKILNHSRSVSISFNDESSPSTIRTANPRQIISRHSSLNRSQLNDESVSADMPFFGSRSSESKTALSSEETEPPVLPRSSTAGITVTQRLDSPGPMPALQELAMSPSLVTPLSIPDMQREDMWSQANAFEGAWDVAIFHTMSEQQEAWPALELFSTYDDMENGGV